MEPEIIRRVGAPGPPPVEGPSEPSHTWWNRYQVALAATGLTETAMRIVDLDSTYLVERGVFGAGHHGDPDSSWPATRLRRGLAMGSVQSGKTASLLGVVAKSLDLGVSLVVVLAGTRIALWKQTYERMVSQLDGWTIASAIERRESRVLLPPPEVIAESAEMPELDRLYFETPNLVRRMLLQGRPLIAVVMKNEDHLMRFSRYLHDILAATLARSSSPLHLMVVDDEADDGSILDKDVETGLAPDSDGLKQIPRHVARLWAGSGPAHETLHNRLFATYLAYTATPQANFLQSDHNPLSPSDFVGALRTPYDTGNVEPPRSTTFAEPLGISRYYTGGEVFYRRLVEPGGALCVTRRFPTRSSSVVPEDFEAEVQKAAAALLSDSLRSYFVSGAIGLLVSKRSLTAARATGPDSLQAIRQLTPSPHTMLYHPSARVSDHFAAAQEVVEWSAAFAVAVPAASGPGTKPELSAEGLRARLTSEGDLWHSWLRSYEQSRTLLSFMPGGHVFPKVDESRWPEIQRILIDDVFPNTRVAVINSDPRADDRPRFHPERSGDAFLPPRDIFTIFVSGNVMARGITLEGLATSLFLRSANEPLADSQMQMQRWFGYRGTQLPRCRVFMYEDQLDLFRGYHEGDEAVRSEIISEMNLRPGEAPSPLVLQGAGFRATGKISNLRALPLCPGSDPFVRVIETGTFAQHNTDVLAMLLETEAWQKVVSAGTMRGVAMKRQMSMLEIAALLESFRYGTHDPSPVAANHDRWRALSSELGIEVPVAPLFRPPGHLKGAPEIASPPNCPYSIAAYLRLWNAALTRRARGLYPTDDRRTPWSMIDLAAYARTAPSFYVGIRYGSADLCRDPRLASRGVQRMDRSSVDGLLVSTWGSRNPGEREEAYLGDQLFDYHVHSLPRPSRSPGEPIWRPRGAPGLFLFHVIRGTDKTADAVTMGLALPAGGPDHIAALRSGTGG